ncbi:MAG: CotH kinase family protein, partial [Bacteroidota bacterium]
TNFKLAKGEEPVLLSRPDGSLSDVLPIIDLDTDISYGRQPDGEGNFQFFDQPTPGGLNAEAIEPVPRIEVSHESGFYTAPFSLTLEGTDSNLVIHYTLDGTLPSIASPRYEGALAINNVSGQANRWSEIRTSFLDWHAPAGPIAKGQILQAQGFRNGSAVTPLLTRSYFVELAYSFPVISIVTDSAHLFSDTTGIYVPGLLGQQNGGTGNAGQRGRAWERPIHFEFFDTTGTLGLRQNLGMRIHGGSSRQLAQKSLRLYARESYGAAVMDYPFFSRQDFQQYKRLILRTPSADWSDTFFKDELCQELVRDRLDLDLQDYLPTVVFLNGEYWGIHNLRERQDEHYLENHYGFPDEELTILEKDGSEGENDPQDYLALLDFVRQNDLSQSENYEWVASRVAIDPFIDYHIAQLYFANQDWPRNNFEFWRWETGEGPWRWFFFDCDFCMIFHHDDHLRLFLDEERFNAFNRRGTEFPEWSILLFQSLLRNDGFRQAFQQRFYQHLGSTFQVDRSLRLIDSFTQVYAPEIAEHIHRWGVPGSLDVWQDNVIEMRNFALQRIPRLLPRLQELLGIPFTLQPNPARGHFRIQTDLANEAPLEIRILSISSQEMASFSFANSAELAAFDFSTTGLSAGLYLVQLSTQGWLFSRKLVVH